MTSSSAMPFVPRLAHRRRLRELWRSAGWPCRDLIEAELLVAGLLMSRRDAQDRETLHLTDLGLAVLTDTLAANRARRDPHEALVSRVAREMQRAGRVVWRGLSLRARVGEDTAADADAQITRRAVERRLQQPQVWDDASAEAEVELAAGPGAAARASGSLVADAGRWAIAMPDVYSIRHTTVEDYLAPIAHEIKVRRADLLADLRRPAKGEAYRWLAGECWYVIAEGIAEPQEIPEVYGVMVAAGSGALQVARPAPQRAMRLPFPVWMALARATPESAPESDQPMLGEVDAAPD